MSVIMSKTFIRKHSHSTRATVMSTIEALGSSKEEKISATEYFRLALSNQRLERCDDNSSDILGLYDPATGRRFIVDREHLLTATLGGRPK